MYQHHTRSVVYFIVTGDLPALLRSYTAKTPDRTDTQNTIVPWYRAPREENSIEIATLAVTNALCVAPPAASDADPCRGTDLLFQRRTQALPRPCAVAPAPSLPIRSGRANSATRAMYPARYSIAP